MYIWSKRLSKPGIEPGTSIVSVLYATDLATKGWRNSDENDVNKYLVLSVGNTDENQDSGMEISNGESSTSEISPDNENPPKYSDLNGGTDSENNDCDKTVRMFKFTVVNSYGTAEIDSRLVDDGNPLKLNSKFYDQSYVLLKWAIG